MGERHGGVTYRISFSFSLRWRANCDRRFVTYQTPFEKVCLAFRTVLLSAMAGAIPFSEPVGSHASSAAPKQPQHSQELSAIPSSCSTPPEKTASTGPPCCFSEPRNATFTPQTPGLEAKFCPF